MSDPYIGEIQAFAFSFAASGFNAGQWAPCLGQQLQVSQNPVLFSLIGAAYGGNGTTNFNLPNLNGHIVVGQGQGPALSDRTLGQSFGEAQVALSTAEMAAHTHALQLGTGTTGSPSPTPTLGAVLLNPVFNGFVDPPSNTTLAKTAISMTGGGQPHQNMQPTLALVYCIALTGIVPSFSS
jgi:microcystin-dependent protein